MFQSPCQLAFNVENFDSLQLENSSCKQKVLRHFIAHFNCVSRLEWSMFHCDNVLAELSIRSVCKSMSKSRPEQFATFHFFFSLHQSAKLQSMTAIRNCKCIEICNVNAPWWFWLSLGLSSRCLFFGFAFFTISSWKMKIQKWKEAEFLGKKLLRSENYKIDLKDILRQDWSSQSKIQALTVTNSLQKLKLSWCVWTPEGMWMENEHNCSQEIGRSHSAVISFPTLLHFRHQTLAMLRAWFLDDC